MNESNLPSQSPAESEDDEIRLVDMAIVLAKHKRLIAGLPVIAALVAAAITLLMPNIFTGTTKILPPQQTQSNAVAILGQLGAVGSVAGGALGIKNPNDVFVAMLKSRTIADQIIERFNLQALYESELLTDARIKLEKNTSITSGKDGVITIAFDNEAPKLAAEVANAYVESLEKLTLNLAVTEASQRRLFFEKQLSKARDDLAAAEMELRRFRETSGVVFPESQASLSVNASASLRAQVTAKEVQLSAMRAFATDKNPEVFKVEQEIKSLRHELSKMENDANIGQGDLLLPIGKAPEIGLAYLQKVRQVKYNETLFEMLARQFEAAKIDEAKNATLIQVLDFAVEPERKSKPKRRLIVMIALLAGIVVAILTAFIRETMRRNAQDPAAAARWQEFRAAFRHSGK